MRFTIHVFPTDNGGRIVHGTLSTAQRSEHWLGDRQANGELWRLAQQEYSVRLDREAEHRPTYQGTIFAAADVARQEE